MRAPFLLVALLAVGLALPARAPAEPAALPLPAATPTEVMALPAELRRRFHDEVLAATGTERERLERIVGFMLDEASLGVAYEEDATYSVAQAYAMRRANCLSFTLLFLALADEAGLDVRPQQISNTLGWHQADGTIYRNHHVNARVMIGTLGVTVDSGGDSWVAGSRPVPITRQRLIAHYYNNLAMQQLARGDATAGLSLMRVALESDSSYAPLWSNAGVLHARNGDLEAAQSAYERALGLDAKDSGALLNMIGLSRRLGDPGREAEFRRRLERAQRRDPLHQFVLALDAERNGNTRRAIRHYRAAIRLYDGEHRFHSALARAYLQAGDYRRAGSALRRAHSLSEGDARAAYAARLRELEQSQER